MSVRHLVIALELAASLYAAALWADVAVPSPSVLAMVALAGLLILLPTARRRLAPITAAVTLLILPLIASATVIPIPANKDTTIFRSTTGSLADGAGPHMFVGENSSGSIRRGLIQFDIASYVPAGAIVNSATLTLYHSRSGPASSTTETLHALLKDWGQGTSNSGDPGGSGAQATPGDATWIHTFYNTSKWTNPGGDFSPTISSSLTLSSTGYASFTGTQLAADVQAWRKTPASNFGWIVLGSEGQTGTAERFETRENSQPQYRPVLSVNFTVVPEPASIAALGASFAFLLGLRRPIRCAN